MFRFFGKPFPREYSPRKSIINAFVSGLIVTIFLVVFKPFGIERAPVEIPILYISGYGIITILVILCFSAIEYLFPKLFLEERWTVGKNILVYVIIIFLIGTANLIYTSAVAGMKLNINTFFSFQLFTLSVTFIVVSMITFLRYTASLRFFETDAKKLLAEFRELKSPQGDEEITLIAENERESVRLKLNDLYYIESADNYSKVVYAQNQKLNSVMLRSSLKRLEQQLNNPEIIRCHRSFIVHLGNIEKVTGNSQGYRLHFREVENTIPVSRKYGKDVHERLIQLKGN